MGVSQAERQEKGPGRECCAMTVCAHTNTTRQRNCSSLSNSTTYLEENTSIMTVCVFLFLFFTFNGTIWARGVRLQPEKKLHLSPELRSEWRVSGTYPSHVNTFPCTTSSSYFFCALTALYFTAFILNLKQKEIPKIFEKHMPMEVNTPSVFMSNSQISGRLKGGRTQSSSSRMEGYSDEV